MNATPSSTHTHSPTPHQRGRTSFTDTNPTTPFQANATAPLTLDDLAAMPINDLTALYLEGTVPDSISALNGAPICRMLRLVGGLGRGGTGNTIRSMARSTNFPWAGKSFAATEDAHGTGFNRVRLAGSHNWFPFETRVEPSAIDGKPCIFLDYDKPENPWFIRKVHDEVREVSPGLFMGPAMWKTKHEPVLVLYFACDVANGNP